MSSHYKFEVFVKTPGEQDDEETAVEYLAALVPAIARLLHRGDLEVTVGEVQRN